MSDKINIEELFKSKLGGYEEKVDAQIWKNISQQLPNAGAQPSSGWSNTFISSTKFWIAAAGVSVISVMGITGYYQLTNEPSSEMGAAQITSLSDSTAYLLQENKDDVQKESTSIEQEQLSYEKNDNQPGKSPQLASHTTESQDSLSAVFSEQEPHQSEGEGFSEMNEEREVLDGTGESAQLTKEPIVAFHPAEGKIPLEVHFETTIQASKVMWDFGDGVKSGELNPVHTYEKAGSFCVTLIAQKENGEVVMDKSFIQVSSPKAIEGEIENNVSITVPNVLTPNNDGINDELIIESNNLREFHLSIYSVGGELVFETNQIENYWNGINTNSGTVVGGTYYYIIKGLDKLDAPIYKKGFITVIAN